MSQHRLKVAVTFHLKTACLLYIRAENASATDLENEILKHRSNGSKHLYKAAL
jgi:hypothetical protein